MAGTNSPQSGDGRIERVEEAVAFNERTVEQLSEEVAALGKRVGALAKQLARIEARLAKMGSEGEEEEGDGTQG